ncbi:MaoC family dehydratase N-terminal domain-containing protein [Sphingosinicella xenopeptidilytica]|uniref:MaoC family dehydratase N-terminal domain-containing protein n=1 Tax=Sphingosinicella xenopeptidilytica TaxID=364098 RepID=A0ABW3C4C2_SPHXN
MEELGSLGHAQRKIRVELGQLKLFAKAIGETNPIYFEAAAAEAAGLPAPLAPPTFSYSLALLAFDSESLSECLGIDRARLLHGEQTFEYFEPVYAQDVLLLRRNVVDRYEKKGGKLSFVVIDTEATNQRNELCVRSRMVGVIQNP